MPDSTINSQDLELLCINTIRTLSIDGVQKANSGHPGAPMALAPAAYALWHHIMNFNPANPAWFDRDRFVLSNGHASMLLYSMLYLTGFELSLDDLKNFRQLDSKTPGHPENHLAPGVETTTGPLGQGIMNAVGMAIAEAHLAAVYNQDNFDIIDHHTFVFCGDGDLMEGASHEAASLAGHLGLGKLIVLYDDNHISIEGETEITYSDDVRMRFQSYGWHVLNLGERANDVEAIAAAFQAAKEETGKPSLIILRTHIGFGAPNKQDTPEVHGSPLGDEEVKLTKRAYGWPIDQPFLVPDQVLAHMRQAVDRGAMLESKWQDRMADYKKKFAELATQLQASIENKLTPGWDSSLPSFSPEDGGLATRSASGKVINAFAEKLPQLLGGSGDLAPSTNTLMKAWGYFARGSYENRNLAWGVREHAMCSAASGMALHGGIRPFVATFLVFTDYARPAIRLASLMRLPVIYVMTHDSIGLGEDGPTHQPIEHLSSLRAIPNLCVIRPADANETRVAWQAALERTSGPTLMALTRQKLPIIDRTKYAAAEGLRKGAYILSQEKSSAPDVILISSGSEVQLVLEAQKKLSAEGIDARVVSMPSWELFAEQPENYRHEVLPPAVKARLAVEAGTTFGWSQIVGDAGDVIGMDEFGASGPYTEVFAKYGFTVENVVSRAKALVSG